jgi:hypothetical protein
LADISNIFFSETNELTESKLLMVESSIRIGAGTRREFEVTLADFGDTN